MLDRHYEDVIGSTPAILGTHELSRFKGQSSPTLFRTSLGEGDIDQPLLAALMARWRRRYEAAKPAWEDVARCARSTWRITPLLPAGTDTTFYDVGRVVSLWVSAFEILVHPGGSGQANRDKVFEMIERAPRAFSKSSQLAHDTGGKTKVKRPWHPGSIKCSTNAGTTSFTAIPSSAAISFSPRRSGRSSNMPHCSTVSHWPRFSRSYTAFRCHRPRCPRVRHLHIADRTDFMGPQKSAEEAILTATRPPAGRAARRARVTRPAP